MQKNNKSFYCILFQKRIYRCKNGPILFEVVIQTTLYLPTIFYFTFWGLSKGIR